MWWQFPAPSLPKGCNSVEDYAFEHTHRAAAWRGKAGACLTGKTVEGFAAQFPFSSSGAAVEKPQSWPFLLPFKSFLINPSGSLCHIREWTLWHGSLLSPGRGRRDWEEAKHGDKLPNIDMCGRRGRRWEGKHAFAWGSQARKKEKKKHGEQRIWTLLPTFPLCLLPSCLFHELFTNSLSREKRLWEVSAWEGTWDYPRSLKRHFCLKRTHGKADQGKRLQAFPSFSGFGRDSDFPSQKNTFMLKRYIHYQTYYISHISLIKITSDSRSEYSHTCLRGHCLVPLTYQAFSLPLNLKEHCWW